MIKRETKKNIIDHLKQENIHFSGKMTDVDFLNRLYELSELPSSSHKNAFDEIKGFDYNGNYYQDINWVFDDPRFKLLNGNDELFLSFLCLMVHPLVRPKTDAAKIVVICNDWLQEAGWELYPSQEKTIGKIFSFRKTNPVHKPKEDEVSHIWEQGKLRFFISHRDTHKADVKKLGEALNEYGISSFVAHESIQPTKAWKDEIMMALQTMDACLCYITDNFYSSVWTNQEVGFAIAKGIPIYLYSVDRTDPKGFKFDIQAIKTGLPELVNCIKRDFSQNNKFKSIFVEKFVDAVDGSFDWAKDRFFDLVGLKLNDTEIEKIVDAFSAKAKYINQLSAVLHDQIKKEEHKKHPKLRTYSYYRDYLVKDLLSQHSTKKYTLKIPERGKIEIRESLKRK